MYGLNVQEGCLKSNITWQQLTQLSNIFWSNSSGRKSGRESRHSGVTWVAPVVQRTRALWVVLPIWTWPDISNWAIGERNLAIWGSGIKIWESGMLASPSDLLIFLFSSPSLGLLAAGQAKVQVKDSNDTGQDSALSIPGVIVFWQKCLWWSP